jgi:(E)-4-hydroxy-3-methylbut-2-enyl-diphosphate synthase
MNDKDTYRMHTKVIQIGDRKIGGGNPIAIQSMTNTKTEDVKATVEQILRLEKAGCDHPLYGTYLRGGSSHP